MKNLRVPAYRQAGLTKDTMKEFSNNKKEYDLEERTAKFAEEVIEFTRSIKKDSINLSLITQLVRSGTSVGANYCEANGASSKRDFRNKIYICKQEPLLRKEPWFLAVLEKLGNSGNKVLVKDII